MSAGVGTLATSRGLAPFRRAVVEDVVYFFCRGFEVLVALGVLDFVHSDGIDLSRNPVFEAPGDDVLDSIEDLCPLGTKRFGGLFPGQASRPAGQEDQV